MYIYIFSVTFQTKLRKWKQQAGVISNNLRIRGLRLPKKPACVSTYTTWHVIVICCSLQFFSALTKCNICSIHVCTPLESAAKEVCRRFDAIYVLAGAHGIHDLPCATKLRSWMGILITFTFLYLLLWVLYLPSTHEGLQAVAGLFRSSDLHFDPLAFVDYIKEISCPCELRDGWTTLHITSYYLFCVLFYSCFSLGLLLGIWRPPYEFLSRVRALHAFALCGTGTHDAIGWFFPNYHN